MNPISSAIDFVRGLLRELLEKEPARLLAYGGAALLAGAAWALGQLGVEIPPTVADALTLLGGFLLIELVRRFVYSPATTQAIADAATFQEPGSSVDIGNPPEGTP